VGWGDEALARDARQRALIGTPAHPHSTAGVDGELRHDPAGMLVSEVVNVVGGTVAALVRVVDDVVQATEIGELVLRVGTPRWRPRSPGATRAGSRTSCSCGVPLETSREQ
jgi:hypothetical protein